MKSPSHMLVDRAIARRPEPADGLRLTRDDAADQLGVPVVDACLFSRPSSDLANRAAGKIGFVAQFALRRHQKNRAGGLPQHFVLAVTADEVVALERTLDARHGPVGGRGPEVARWSRSTLQVDSDHGGYLVDVRLSAPGVDAIECCVVKTALSESFVTLLADPARTTAC